MMRDDRGLGWMGRIIAVLIVGAVYFGAYYYFFAPRLPAVVTPSSAETADFVEVDYIGWFPDSNRYFDTSLESVAKDNVTYLKAASFTYRKAPSKYEPLQFIVGCTPGTGCPLPAFQDAVRGMHVGDTKRIELPPEKAYGPSDPTRIRVRPLLEDVTATETIDRAAFQERYGLGPQDGSIVTDPTWGWNVTVRVSGDLVTIRNSPTLNQVVRVAGRWSARVVAIDDATNGGKGAIRVRHLLTPADVGAFVAADRVGNFIVVALDANAGTYTVDYNNEIVGKALDFEITLVSLRKGRP